MELPLHLSPKYSRRRGWSATRVRKVRRAVPSSCLDRRSAAEQWSEITASPHHKLSWVLKKDIPRMSRSWPRSKICGLHLRRPCTVVAGRPKTRSRWREERESVRELDWDVVRTMMAKVKTRLRNVVVKSSPEFMKFHLNTPWSYPEQDQFAKSQKIMKVSFLELIKICAIFWTHPYCVPVVRRGWTVTWVSIIKEVTQTHIMVFWRHSDPLVRAVHDKSTPFNWPRLRNVTVSEIWWKP